MKSTKTPSSIETDGALEPKIEEQELSSLQDRLSFDMEQQIQILHHELLQELEDIVKKHDQPTTQQHTNPTLSSLIHTITDSKLHKLNMELRQHMTVKLDALLEDMKDEHRAFRTQLWQEMDRRLERPDTAKASFNRFLASEHQLASSTWLSLPVLIASIIVLVLLISWPS